MEGPVTSVARSPAAGAAASPERPAEVADAIICGDAAQALRELPAGFVRCAITSPPYWKQADYGFEGQIGQEDYQEYLERLLEVWRETERVLAPNGKLCINAPIMPISKRLLTEGHTRTNLNLSHDIEQQIVTQTGLRRFSLYVWQKQTTEAMFGSYPHPPNLYEQNTIEFINVFVKAGKPERLARAAKERSRLSAQEWMDLTRQVWSIYPANVKRDRGHPAPFPLELPSRLIRMYTFAAAPEHGFPGDIVLDMFNGTGTTCVAAASLGRRYLGVDAKPEFCAVAERRLAALQDEALRLPGIGEGQEANGDGGAGG